MIDHIALGSVVYFFMPRITCRGGDSVKRNQTNSKNTKRVGNIFRKIIMHIVLLSLMMMLESMIALKLRIMPEKINRINFLVFLSAAGIPAILLQNEKDFYEVVKYYLWILLIWSTIGMGFFDSGIIGLKRLALSILASVIMLFTMGVFISRKSVNKFKHR